MWQGTGTVSRRQALFGGVGEVRVWSLLDGTLPPFECVLGCELDPGGTVGRHVQEKSAEVVVITEGEGLAHVNGQPYPLTPGQVVLVAQGQVLDLANHSQKDPLRYLIIKASR